MTAWHSSQAFGRLCTALAVIGLAAVAALSLPSLDAGVRLALRTALAAIWNLFLVELLARALAKGSFGAPRGMPVRLADLAAVLVPLAAFAPGVEARDQSLFCGVWALKLLGDSAASRLVARVLAHEARNLLGVLLIFAIVLFAAAFAAHVLERDAQPDLFGSIPQAMWWGVVTLTTTGYGDAIPQSAAGRLLAGAVMMSGIGLFALWAGILASGFSDELRRQDFVRNWKLVSEVPLFGQLSPSGLVEIVRALRPRTASAGSVICRKGAPGDEMYFIVEGIVSVAAANPVELGAGQFFGEIALVTGEPRSATVTASTPVSLLTLHSSDFQVLMSRSPEIADAVRKTALERRSGGTSA